MNLPWLSYGHHLAAASRLASCLELSRLSWMPWPGWGFARERRTFLGPRDSGTISFTADESAGPWPSVAWIFVRIQHQTVHRPEGSGGLKSLVSPHWPGAGSVDGMALLGFRRVLSEPIICNAFALLFLRHWCRAQLGGSNGTFLTRALPVLGCWCCRWPQQRERDRPAPSSSCLFPCCIPPRLCLFGLLPNQLQAAFTGGRIAFLLSFLFFFFPKGFLEVKNSCLIQLLGVYHKPVTCNKLAHLLVRQHSQKQTKWLVD